MPASRQSPGAAAPDDRLVAAVRALARAGRLLERSAPELSLAHYRVLSAIAAGDDRASRIAAKFALGKPAISASVDALCRRGLLERVEHVGDQRVASLRLTTAGRRELRRTEDAMTSRLAQVCGPDLDEVCDALARLDASIEQRAVAHATRATR